MSDHRLRRELRIHIGGVEASRDPAVIKTVLGSCVSACLWDPVTKIGGMNHFMLPHPTQVGSNDSPARFGVHAMDLLIGAIQRLGGDRRRLVAKLFGGGHVLREQKSLNSVPQQNIAFIEKFVSQEGLEVVAQDLGGTNPRYLHFCTDTGKAFVKKLGEVELRDERFQQKRYVRTTKVKPAYGEIELFGD